MAGGPFPEPMTSVFRSSEVFPPSLSYANCTPAILTSRPSKNSTFVKSYINFKKTSLIQSKNIPFVVSKCLCAKYTVYISYLAWYLCLMLYISLRSRYSRFKLTLKQLIIHYVTGIARSLYINYALTTRTNKYTNDYYAWYYINVLNVFGCYDIQAYTIQSVSAPLLILLTCPSRHRKHIGYILQLQGKSYAYNHENYNNSKNHTTMVIESMIHISVLYTRTDGSPFVADWRRRNASNLLFILVSNHFAWTAAVAPRVDSPLTTSSATQQNKGHVLICILGKLNSNQTNTILHKFNNNSIKNNGNGPLSPLLQANRRGKPIRSPPAPQQIEGYP